MSEYYWLAVSFMIWLGAFLFVSVAVKIVRSRLKKKKQDDEHR